MTGPSHLRARWGVKREKSQTNLIKHVGVTRTSCFTSRWRSKRDSILTHRWVQDGTLMKREKFEANRIMYVEVMRTSCFTSRWRYKCDSILTHRDPRNPTVPHFWKSDLRYKSYSPKCVVVLYSSTMWAIRIFLFKYVNFHQTWHIHQIWRVWQYV